MATKLITPVLILAFVVAAMIKGGAYLVETGFLR